MSWVNGAGGHGTGVGSPVVAASEPSAPSSRGPTGLLSEPPSSSPSPSARPSAPAFGVGGASEAGVVGDPWLEEGHRACRAAVGGGFGVLDGRTVAGVLDCSTPNHASDLRLIASVATLAATISADAIVLAVSRGEGDSVRMCANFLGDSDVTEGGVAAADALLVGGLRELRAECGGLASSRSLNSPNVVATMCFTRASMVSWRLSASCAAFRAAAASVMACAAASCASRAACATAFVAASCAACVAALCASRASHAA